MDDAVRCPRVTLYSSARCACWCRCTAPLQCQWPCALWSLSAGAAAGCRCQRWRCCMMPLQGAGQIFAPVHFGVWALGPMQGAAAGVAARCPALEPRRKYLFSQIAALGCGATFWFCGRCCRADAGCGSAFWFCRRCCRADAAWCRCSCWLWSNVLVLRALLPNRCWCRCRRWLLIGVLAQIAASYKGFLLLNVVALDRRFVLRACCGAGAGAGAGAGSGSAFRFGGAAAVLVLVLDRRSVLPALVQALALDKGFIALRFAGWGSVYRLA